MLQRKFYSLVKDVEQRYISDIVETAETCAILHHMMVKEHADWDERMNCTIGMNAIITLTITKLLLVQQKKDLHHHQQELFYDGPAIDV